MTRSFIFLGIFLGILAQANAQPSDQADQAAARAKQLKTGIKTFRLELLYALVGSRV